MVEHDFIIVDFEGEPFRPMDERRRKHSPLRDVAGMLRSFSYAAAIALDEATSDRPADRVRAAAHMTRWERETAAAFLAGYARAVRGASSYPSDPDDVARLIDLFVLEKALYEVRYELGSRPDWVRIPHRRPARTHASRGCRLVNAGEHATAAPISVWRGKPRPLGATWDGAGVNFALYSENAERVELCLFDPKGRREIERIDIRERTELRLALLSARSPSRPALRLPRARSVRAGARPSLQPAQAAARSLRPPDRRAAALDRCAFRLPRRQPARRPVVRHARQRVGDAQVPGRSTPRSPGATTSGRERRGNDTVIYELHVKGFTQLHPAIRPQLRGTYAGLSTAPVIEHLQRLGVTAVELLPVHALRRRQGAGRSAGCATTGATTASASSRPRRAIAAGDAVNEFKTMVKTLHAAGIEVMLDVVYNHTAEGNHLGPTLSFRGIDNRVYYRLDAEQSAPLRRLHRHRQHAQHRASARRCSW